jgi:hypothetical protein
MDVRTHTFDMNSHSWNELVATNALVEDEVVQAILRMNKKHILPARNY